MRREPRRYVFSLGRSLLCRQHGLGRRGCRSYYYYHVCTNTFVMLTRVGFLLIIRTSSNVDAQRRLSRFGLPGSTSPPGRQQCPRQVGQSQRRHGFMGTHRWMIDAIRCWLLMRCSQIYGFRFTAAYDLRVLKSTGLRVRGSQSQ